MGMHDSFEIVGDTRFPFTCIAGHPVRDFQSKNWGCMLQHFTVFGDRVYERSYRRVEDTRREVVDAGTLVEHVSIRQELVLVRRYDRVTLYTDCLSCTPVLTRSHFIQEHFPWVELDVRLDDGAICKVTKSPASETRGSVRSKLLLLDHMNVLADDNPAAALHMSQRCPVSK